MGVIGEEIVRSKKKIGSDYWVKPEVGPWSYLSPTQLQSLSGCSESPLLRVDDGMAQRMGSIKNELRIIGNGVVPQTSILAWELIKKLARRT